MSNQKNDEIFFFLSANKTCARVIALL